MKRNNITKQLHQNKLTRSLSAYIASWRLDTAEMQGLNWSLFTYQPQLYQARYLEPT